MAETEFQRQVYALCRQIPPGKVTTYKAVAEALGTKAYRAVGQALRRNPFAPEVPCHRVIAADGSLGGYCGERSGAACEKKIHLLHEEGIMIQDGKVLLGKNFWGFLPHGRN
ncbi:MGMT family protein [Candidatus Woesearchaeota archaeon]|nr:MGMT family protein [Candidatus Woesearchaeota archaeon]